MQTISINGKTIGDGHPTYIIAEVGLAHQGDMRLAKRLIDAAKEAGADCVKFQKRSLSDLYKKDVLAKPEAQEHAQQYLLEHIVHNELSEKQMRELSAYAKKRGIDFAATPWDEKSMRFLNTLDMPFFKIGSPDMFNLPLLKKVARTGKPVIMSVGFASLVEIELAVKTLRQNGSSEIALLHCLTSYGSTPDLANANLKTIKDLETRFGVVAGFSDNNAGIELPVKAVMAGWIEWGTATGFPAMIASTVS